MNNYANYEILKIGSNPLPLRFISEIYLSFLNKKYLPIIDVYNTKTKKQFSIIVGASSLAVEFEKLRLDSDGKLIDLECWVHKESDDKYAKYLVTAK